MSDEEKQDYIDQVLSEREDREYEGLVVSDLSEVPFTYTGEVLHVNDHGNVTIYSVRSYGKFKEIASRV